MLYGHLGEAIRCGQCKAELPAPALPIEVATEAHFDTLVRDSALPIVVDFWAPWCGPCKMVEPELRKVATANAGRLVIVKVDTEALPGLAGRFQVMSIPAMSVFAGGREVGRTVGARPARAIESFVNDSLGH